MDKNRTAMDFWGRVEIAQKEAGITSFKSLCKNAGLLYNSIMNNRSQGKLPEITSIASMAKELGTSIDWLIFGENRPWYMGDEQIMQVVMADERLMRIVRDLVHANPEQINAIKYILRIE